MLYSIDFIDSLLDWFENNNIKNTIIEYFLKDKNTYFKDILIILINNTDKYKFYQFIDDTDVNLYKYSNFTMVDYNDNQILFDYDNIINYLNDKYINIKINLY
jgi:hypothetical protein